MTNENKNGMNGEDGGIVNDLFSMQGIAIPEEENQEQENENQTKKQNPKSKKSKKKSGDNDNSCAADASKAGKKNKGNEKQSKEPEKDMPRLVYLTQENEQKEFQAEYSLEDMRKEIEKEYPAYTFENTNWWVEKQQDRYLCVASYKINKAG